MKLFGKVFGQNVLALLENSKVDKITSIVI